MKNILHHRKCCRAVLGVGGADNCWAFFFRFNTTYLYDPTTGADNCWALFSPFNTYQPRKESLLNVVGRCWALLVLYISSFHFNTYVEHQQRPVPPRIFYNRRSKLLDLTICYGGCRIFCYICWKLVGVVGVDNCWLLRIERCRVL